jgi:hypothetical protein
LSLRGRLGDRSNPSESAEIKSHRRQSKDDPEIHACLGSTSGRPPVEIRLFTSDKLTMACKQKSSCESQSVSQSFNSRIFTGGNPRTIRDQSSAAPVNDVFRSVNSGWFSVILILKMHAGCEDSFNRKDRKEHKDASFAISALFAVNLIPAASVAAEPRCALRVRSRSFGCRQPRCEFPGLIGRATHQASLFVPPHATSGGTPENLLAKRCLDARQTPADRRATPAVDIGHAAPA